MRVVVVGSGVVGASVAYHVARQGTETVLVDDDALGQATAAGAGIVCPWSSKVTDPTWQRLADDSAAYYPRLIDHLAADGETETGYRRVGALRLAAADVDALYDQLLARSVGSPQAGELTVVRDAREMFPPLRENTAAVHISGGARVDGRLLRDAMRNATANHGGRLVSGTATLVRSGAAVTAVDVAGERIDADTVVVATGAWSQAILAPLGIRPDVTPQRGQIVHVGLSGTDTSAWPAVLPPSSHYLLAFDGGRVVVGATRETGSGFDYRVTAAGLHEVLTEALAVAPGLADGTVLETRIGFRPASPDILPLIGRLSDVDGIVIATGMGPTGLTLGPYGGRLAAAVALGRDPDADLTPYDPVRSIVSR
jgi:D-amino-acid dehydrogenase